MTEYSRDMTDEELAKLSEEELEGMMIAGALPGDLDMTMQREATGAPPVIGVPTCLHGELLAKHDPNLSAAPTHFDAPHGDNITNALSNTGDQPQEPQLKLGRLAIAQKTGQEQFRREGKPIGFDLLSFWQWQASDLVSNATRGVLAEYLVARALGLDTSGVRNEWDAYDLQLPSGLKVEVKSAGFLQSWAQRGLSKISFSVQPRRHWDYDANLQGTVPVRSADLYVFALLHHKDKGTVDPTDVSQWTFYVVDTSKLEERNRSQHSITLASLDTEKLAQPVPFQGILDAVSEIERTILSRRQNSRCCERTTERT